jgi:hypothetical protein
LGSENGNIPEAFDLWEVVEEDYEVHPMPTNPIMARSRNHKERKTRKSKAKTCLFAAVSTTIFTRIMSLKLAKDIWDYLKKEYGGMKEFVECKASTWYESLSYRE